MEGSTEEYNLEADGVTILVQITRSKGGTHKYNLIIPTLEKPTLALLSAVRHELILKVPVATKELLDPDSLSQVKEKFKKEANLIISRKLPYISDKMKAFLIGQLLHEMVGLGTLEFLLNDDLLEELVFNSAKEPVRVYHKKYGWLDTNVLVEDEAKINNYASMIGRRVGRQITTLDPILDAHLVTGDRVNAVLYPISNKGNSITIRKFARDPWTLTDFIKNNTTTDDVFALIWIAIQYEMNILISGGTGSGKTSLLNVCMPFIPPNNRIVSIEDTRELQLPSFLHWCPMVTRLPNPEGKGGVTMLDLLVNSLRMRPDRIVLGEMRRREEGEVLFEAMHTGRSVYATVHADTMAETIKRLVNPPIQIPPNLLGAVNLNVVMFRDRRKGIRRVSQMGEFIPSEDEQGLSVRPNILYRWKPSNDQMVPHSKSLRLFEELSRTTGMSQLEIDKDLRDRKQIFQYMVKNNIRSVEDVGKVMNQFYIDPEFVIQTAKQGKNPKIILENV